jgi:hypothetical protein
MAWLKRAAALAAAGVLLCACGGGDGGGGGAPSFSVSTNSVSFSATEGGPAPAAQVVSITVNSGTVYVGIFQTPGNFTATFDITGERTGTVTITPGPATTPGTFTGTVTITGCDTPSCANGQISGSPQLVSVTYTVAANPAPSVSVTPGFLNFTGDGTQSVSVSSNQGSVAYTTAINYTPVPSNNWLSVPANGTLPDNTVNFVVSTTGLAAGSYAATVTFTAGGATKDVSVTLTVTTPGVNFVSPYVAIAGVAGEVILRGNGFSALNAGLTTVQFGGTPATAVSIDSDTQIRATHPALAVGSHALSVTDGTLTPPVRAEARLVVVDAPAYTYQALNRIGPNAAHAVNLVHDAERQQVYLMDRDRNRIERFRYDGLAWLAGGTLQFSEMFAANWSIALSPDGTELLKTGAGSIARVNPANLAPIGNVAPPAGNPLLNAQFQMIAFANDGKAIANASAVSGVSLLAYDLLAQSFTPLSSQFDFVNRFIAASGDGSRLLLPEFSPLITGTQIYTYSALDGALTGSAALESGVYQVRVSRTGNRAIVASFLLTASEVTRVYDVSLALQGTLPTGILGVAISPDGGTAYALIAGEIRKYDLNSPNGGGGFTEVLPRTVLPDSPGTGTAEMAVSPDGGTLFLAGNQRLIVMPAP